MKIFFSSLFWKNKTRFACMFLKEILLFSIFSLFCFYGNCRYVDVPSYIVILILTKRQSAGLWPYLTLNIKNEDQEVPVLICRQKKRAFAHTRKHTLTHTIHNHICFFFCATEVCSILSYANIERRTTFFNESHLIYSIYQAIESRKC